MVHRSAEWFRNVAVLAAVVALLMVPAVSALLAGSLPLWLHIPVIGLALTAMAGGAAITGIALVEYRARLFKVSAE